MNAAASRHLLIAGTLLAALAAGSCGNGATATAGGPGMPINVRRGADGRVIDDGSLCEWKGRNDVEVSETAGTGSIQPNVRRVYKVFGSGASRRKVLICREVDTNLDGLKDVVRTYNDEGQSKEERADTNYDGKLDTWNYFAGGRIAEERLDKNYDGEPDEWKVYHKGKLIRIKRDTDFNKKPDVWEMFRKGRLERMGVDLDGDERVDRWDHDTEWRRKLEQTEKRKEEEEERKKKEAADKARRDAEEEADADKSGKDKSGKDKSGKDKSDKDKSDEEGYE